MAIVVAVGLIAVGCRSESTTPEAGPDPVAGATTVASSAPGAFGDLKNVCQPGNATGATDQGVTDTAIDVGTITDYSFTHDQSPDNTAKAFTEWCNAAGGINGRKLQDTVRDTKLFEYRQRILDACPVDFMLVGGTGSFDGTGVKDRLSCLLPEFTAQSIDAKNAGSDLQFQPVLNTNPSIYYLEGFYTWLLDKYPDSKGAVGFIKADADVVKVRIDQAKETIAGLGANVVYDDLFPPIGVSDWGPYAQAIKSAGVKGLVFSGNPQDLPKLEQALQDANYTLDWIDANPNSYSKSFLDLTGPLTDQQPNYTEPGVFPLEKSPESPANQQLTAIFKQYVPDGEVNSLAVAGWSAWLLFAQSARDCGSQLTRKCVLDNAAKNKAWTAGGVQPPVDLSDKTSKRVCFTVEHASSSGWTPIELNGPDGKYYRCIDNKVTLQGNYPKPVTLADVGKTMDDLK